MDQKKIGKFILKMRKENKLTQAQLAEKLGVSEKSVGNWENGRNMPDLSLFKPLCDVLGISVNDLLSGEKVDRDQYSSSFEENIVNTIDYIDKRNVKNNTIVNILFVVIGFVLIICSFFVLGESLSNGIMNVIGLMVMISGLNRLLVYKCSYFKRLILLILVVCLFIRLMI